MSSFRKHIHFPYFYTHTQFHMNTHLWDRLNYRSTARQIHRSSNMQIKITHERWCLFVAWYHQNNSQVQICQSELQMNTANSSASQAGLSVHSCNPQMYTHKMSWFLMLLIILPDYSCDCALLVLMWWPQLSCFAASLSAWHSAGPFITSLRQSLELMESTVCLFDQCSASVLNCTFSSCRLIKHCAKFEIILHNEYSLITRNTWLDSLCFAMEDLLAVARVALISK